jgi:hypothetical protein
MASFEIVELRPSGKAIFKRSPGKYSMTGLKAAGAKIYAGAE